MLKHFNTKNWFGIMFLVLFVLLSSGCDIIPGRHMRDQPKFEPLEASTLFDDGRSARDLPANTVPRGEWYEIRVNEVLYTGMEDDQFVDTIPISVDRDVVLRGQERYNIYCAPCHGRVGDGLGMIVQRGMKQPNSFHIEQVRSQPDGYYYNAISNGFGVMYSYASRIQPEDRWAIVAYIRALQFSQNAPVDILPDEERQQLESLVE